MTTLEELKALLKESYNVQDDLQPTDELMGQSTGDSEFDSLDLVQMWMQLEEKYQFAIDDAEMRRHKTLGEITAYIDQHKGSASGTRRAN